MHLQHNANHRGINHIYQGLYNSVPQGQFNSWMTPDQFTSYVGWPGDKPIFSRWEGAAATREGPFRVQ